jgi:hypothetical protein
MENEIDVVFPNKAKNLELAITYILELLPKLDKKEKVVEFGDVFKYEKSFDGNGGTLYVSDKVYNSIESTFGLKRGVLKKLLKIIISQKFNLDITNVEKGGYWFG